MNPSYFYAYSSNFLLYIPRHSFDQYVDMSVLVIAGWQSKGRQKGSTTVVYKNGETYLVFRLTAQFINCCVSWFVAWQFLKQFVSMQTLCSVGLG
jgi:hypothetical protein